MDTAQSKKNIHKLFNSESRWHMIIWLLTLFILVISLLLYRRLAILEYLNITLSAVPKENTPAIPADYYAGLELRIASSASQSAVLQSGQNYRLEIWLNTSKQDSIGTDAVINYDPDMLRLNSVTAGDIFDNYPEASFSAKTGIIQISGVSPKSLSYKGQGILGSVLFSPLQKGSTKLSFEFIKGDTRESNVISADTGRDILSGVQNLSLTIE